jgi:hypothetical protein
MPASARPIVFLSDFGLGNEWVGNLPLRADPAAVVQRPHAFRQQVRVLRARLDDARLPVSVGHWPAARYTCTTVSSTQLICSMRGTPNAHHNAP